MLPIEKIRIAIFVGCIAAVYLATGILLARRARRWLRPSARPAGRFEVWVSYVVFSLAVMGLFCFAYGYFVEPYQLDVTHVRIASPKIPRGTRPIRIVEISDLHSDPKVRLENRLPKVIAAQKPDLIFFAGDTINSVQGLPIFKKCLTQIARLAPTYVVRGNWDVDLWSKLDLFGGTGAHELNGNAVRVEVAGAQLWLVGAPARHEDRIWPALKKVPPGAFTLCLLHYPDEIYQVAKHNVDLYLAGHTHGGQVALPFYGALATDSIFDKRFESGLYKVHHTWLYVNRGIGMEGHFAPRVRFCATPEVTDIELVSSD